jgi:hypothetical protein
MENSNSPSESKYASGTSPRWEKAYTVFSGDRATASPARRIATIFNVSGFVAETDPIFRKNSKIFPRTGPGTSGFHRECSFFSKTAISVGLSGIHYHSTFFHRISIRGAVAFKERNERFERFEYGSATGKPFFEPSANGQYVVALDRVHFVLRYEMRSVFGVLPNEIGHAFSGVLVKNREKPARRNPSFDAGALGEEFRESLGPFSKKRRLGPVESRFSELLQGLERRRTVQIVDVRTLLRYPFGIFSKKSDVDGRGKRIVRGIPANARTEGMAS